MAGEPARWLVVAVGNDLRRDDGAAAAVLARLERPGGGATFDAVTVHGLVPELADTMAGYTRVVIVDADVGAATVVVERLVMTDAQRAAPVLGHWLDAPGLARLAADLYGFAGELWLCRVPAHDLGHGEGLSAATTAAVAEATDALEALFGATRG